MAVAEQSSGSSVSFRDVTGALTDILGGTTKTTSQSVNMAGGDVAMLRKVLDSMSASTDEAGMDKLFKLIFKQGYEENMPALLTNAVASGVRPAKDTASMLKENDLIARLAGASFEALNKRQTDAGNLAALLAEQTKVPTVTTTTNKEEKGGLLGQIGGIFGF